MPNLTDVLFRSAIGTVLNWIHANEDVRSRCVFASQPTLELRAGYRLCRCDSLYRSACSAIPGENRHFIGRLEQRKNVFGSGQRIRSERFSGFMGSLVSPRKRHRSRRGPIGIVAIDFNNFGDIAVSGSALDVDHDIERVGDIRLDGAVRQFNSALKDTARKPRKSLPRRVRMDRGERSRMAGIEKLQEIERLAAANLTKDQAVGR